MSKAACRGWPRLVPDPGLCLHVFVPLRSNRFPGDTFLINAGRFRREQTYWLGGASTGSFGGHTIVAKPAPTKTTDQARQGETTGVVRWVLGISLALAIVAMVLVYIFST